IWHQTAKSQCEHDKARDRFEMAGKIKCEGSNGRRHGHAGQYGYTTPAEEPECTGHQNFREPLLRIPDSSRERKRKYIVIQHRPVAEHPLAGADVPESVTIIEDARRNEHERKDAERRKRRHDQRVAREYRAIHIPSAPTGCARGLSESS